MFSIQTNKEIRVNRGDTFMYPLYINLGSNYQPEIYSLRIPLEITATQSLDVEIDEDKWRYKVLSAGTYTFIYINNEGTLNSESVDLEDYGIEVTGTPSANDEIEITLSLINNESTIRFEIYNYNQFSENPISQKVIYPKENRVIQFTGDTQEYSLYENCVDSLGRVIIQFHEEDTENLTEGKYLYQIRAYLYNEYKNGYDIITLTNRTPIYIIDDDFTQRTW